MYPFVDTFYYCHNVNVILDFNDTVNHSVAFRIHVSWTTREKLVELGGYNILYRGEVELKVV